MVFKISQHAMQQRAVHQHEAAVHLRALRLSIGGRAALLPLTKRFRPERNLIHQQGEEPFILAGKAHHVGPVGKLGGQPERRAQREAGQQVRYAADRIEPFLPRVQAQRRAAVPVQFEHRRQAHRFASRHGAPQHPQHFFAQPQFALLPEAPQPPVSMRGQRGGRHVTARLPFLAAGTLCGAGGQQTYPLRRRRAYVIAKRICLVSSGMHASPVKQFLALPVAFAVRPQILPKNHLPPSMQSLVC